MRFDDLLEPSEKQVLCSDVSYGSLLKVSKKEHFNPNWK